MAQIELLWLWCRPAATAPNGPLTWKLPYAAGAALKKKKWRGVGGGDIKDLSKDLLWQGYSWLLVVKTM